MSSCVLQTAVANVVRRDARLVPVFARRVFLDRNRRQRKRPAPVICAGRTRWGGIARARAGAPRAQGPSATTYCAAPSLVAEGGRLHLLDSITIAGVINAD
jgi:hypothetical protein